MDFEFFTSKLWQQTAKPLASLFNDRIHLNSAAVSKYGLKKGIKILLGYNKDTKTIGIKILADGDISDGARKLSVNQAHASITARRFLGHFGITERGRYQLEYDESQKVLYFALGQRMKF